MNKKKDVVVVRPTGHAGAARASAQKNIVQTSY
jgi:hypothetical protein